MMLSVGQKLWFVPSDRRGQPRFDAIVKIGRKWAYLDSGYKIDMETMLADGGVYSSPGTAYLSKEDHAEYLRAGEKRRLISEAFRGIGRRLDLSEKQLDAVAEIIGLRWPQ